MTAEYSKILNEPIPQSEPLNGKQVQNRSGGYAFEADKWSQLERFLILGVESDTYYASQRELVTQNVNILDECIDDDARRVVETISKISESYRAPSNSPSIFSMAYCMKPEHEEYCRAIAVKNIDRVCRTGSHILEFAKHIDLLRGWGRLVKRAFEVFYLQEDVENLCYQTIKYRRRHGWSHKDVLRKVRPTPPTREHDTLFEYITSDEWTEGLEKNVSQFDDLEKIIAFEKAKRSDDGKEVSDIINKYGIPRECTPTHLRCSKKLWESLLVNRGNGMPVWALLRNLNKLTSVGVITDLSEHKNNVCDLLTDKERVVNSGVHPLKVLNALHQYKKGNSNYGNLVWTPVSDVVDALDQCFYHAFDNAESSGQNTLLALDVSGSMSSNISGGNISCRMASAAMALVTMNVEPYTHTIGFRSGESGHYGTTSMEVLKISPRQRLDDAMDVVRSMPFGSTDCSLPMVYAQEKCLDIDNFVIYTDSETNYGDIHPQKALEQYRVASGNDGASMAVVSMTANEFTIADPADPKTIDVVGFDTSTPDVIAQFAKGEF